MLDGSDSRHVLALMKANDVGEQASPFPACAWDWSVEALTVFPGFRQILPSAILPSLSRHFGAATIPFPEFPELLRRPAGTHSTAAKARTGGPLYSS